MNAKTCKQLRYTARVLTRGKPDVAYTVTKVTKFEPGVGAVIKGIRLLDPACTRGRYHLLKKITTQNKRTHL
jgi:hypothetical protein